jgi:hypothetical protein
VCAAPEPMCARHAHVRGHGSDIAPRTCSTSSSAQSVSARNVLQAKFMGVGCDFAGSRLLMLRNLTFCPFPFQHWIQHLQLGSGCGCWNPMLKGKWSKARKEGPELALGISIGSNICSVVQGQSSAAHRHPVCAGEGGATAVSMRSTGAGLILCRAHKGMLCATHGSTLCPGRLGGAAWGGWLLCCSEPSLE